MADLSTTYLGLRLSSPLVPSASPLAREVDNLKRMEDNRAGAVVLHSLFEEEILADRDELESTVEARAESGAEAVSYFPALAGLRQGPELYLEHVARAKKAVKIPVIASLNAAEGGAWTEYAAKIQEAGADALELNLYRVVTDPELPGQRVEEAALEVVRSVKARVRIPLAVKITPYYASLPNMARGLVRSGAQALVLFNRFMQPDLDVEEMDARGESVLSGPEAQRLPLRWTALLYGRVDAGLAASGGVSEGVDAVKMILAGADVVMLCSALLRHGVAQLKVVEKGLVDWMAGHGYDSVESMKGVLSHKKVPDPQVFERAQYMKGLMKFQPARAVVSDRDF